VSRNFRIIVAGDVIRPTADGDRSSQNVNIQWLHKLVRRPLMQATGVEPALMLAGRDFDFKAFYAKCGTDASLLSWAGLYKREDLPSAALEMIYAHFGDALVIGFELNALFRRAFEYLGIPYIDCVIHPVRFLDDLMFGVSTNLPGVFEAAMGWRYDEERIYLAAAAIEARSIREKPLLPPDIRVLAMGQTTDDKTLIHEGRIGRWSDFRPAMKSLTGPRDRIAFKPHPYALGEVDVYDAGLAFSRIVETSENFYKLVSHEQIETVVSLSSSTSTEARYFGRKGVHLLQEPFSFATTGAEGFALDRYIAVFDDWMSSDFWRSLLGPVMGTSSTDGSRVHPSPHRLRVSLNAFWGFNEVSIDQLIAPSLVKLRK